MIFLSTLPARGATKHRPHTCGPIGISIHAPREGSDGSPVRHYFSRQPFLSTLPARGATGIGRVQVWSKKFLSTLPARGATRYSDLCIRLSGISIHAPREGSDVSLHIQLLLGKDFYPRSPRGERRCLLWLLIPGKRYFYPRSPRGERLSTTHSAEGCPYFYPRSPRGERHCTSV